MPGCQDLSPGLEYAAGPRRVAGARWLSWGQPTWLVSIWSKSPTPLVIPPPPDHCHITACTLDSVTPPKNRAQVEVFGTHQPIGGGEMRLVPSV